MTELWGLRTEEALTVKYYQMIVKGNYYEIYHFA